MVSSFYFFASLILFYSSSFGCCNQIVTSNNGIPGYFKNVSFNGNNLDINSFPIVNLQLKTLISGTVKFSMDLPDGCEQRNITLSYGSAKCEILFVYNGFTVIINKVNTLRPYMGQMVFELENNKVNVNGHEYSGLCDSMPTDIYTVSILGACQTSITFVIFNSYCAF
uniref:Uncharacterized protein n=1 Tax=Panagrolaimus superbus TaxID=310955 RepID=A0A914ZAX0_9BILA